MKKTVTIYSSHHNSGEHPQLLLWFTDIVEAILQTPLLYDLGSPAVLFRTSKFLSPARLVRKATSSVST